VEKLTLSASSDEALLHLVKVQDEAALEMLYDSKSRLVYSLAFSIVKNVSDAEEITQEVFWRIWQKADAFDSKRGSVLAWLTTMTRRLAIDRIRSKQYKTRNREVSMEVEPVDETVGEQQVSIEDHLLKTAQTSEVVEALNRLDDKYREVIQLSYFEGLSHAKIADHLATPLGTIKSRIRQAVDQLRRLLDVEV
jgi:RNA polymerase sigma-70 factor (ECF subfamily)